MSTYDALVTSSKEFEESRIPVMALLVEHGADVNEIEVTRHMVVRIAIVYAVMAGRWKSKVAFRAGADPEVRGLYGGAVDYAK